MGSESDLARAGRDVDDSWALWGSDAEGMPSGERIQPPEHLLALLHAALRRGISVCTHACTTHWT